MGQLLKPAIDLAENGVPIPKKTALMWDKCYNRIKISKQCADLSNNDRAPLPGEKIYVPKLAQSLKVIGLSTLIYVNIFLNS